MRYSIFPTRRAVAAATFALGLSVVPVAITSALAQSVFHRGNDSDPETLDPQKTQTTAEAHLLRDLFEGLVIHNAKGEVVAGVAEKWDISADGKTYTFTLRQNAKWSNGDPVVAGDFVYSLRRIMTPATGAKYANILYPILNAEKINKSKDGAKPEDLGVSAPNATTLEIKLERPTAYFLELLTHTTGIPVHPASVEKHGKDFVKVENWVSNGAYKLKENTPNAQIVVVKNPNFHAAASVRIDEVRFYPRSDLAAAARQFQAGELQFTTDIPGDQVKFLKEKLGSQVSIAPYLGTYYLTINTSKAPFNDANVRMALSLAIDREFIADQVWAGTMVPAYGFVPPGISNYVAKPVELEFKSASPIDREDKAKALLKEAGFGPGKPLKVQIRFNQTDNNKATVVAIADQWKAVGIETEFISTDGKTHFAHLREGGDFDVARAGWIADYSDAQNFLFLGLSDNKGMNYAKYKNPKFDELVKKSDNETDLKKRAEIMAEAEKVWMADQPVIPLMFYSTKNLVSSRLKGFTPNLRGAFASRFYELTN
jgi:oligopeptide transport system substrate-binding protein